MIWVIGISKQIRIKSEFANLIPICFEIEVCSAKGKAKLLGKMGMIMLSEAKIFMKSKKL
jgi:hypothetical protein